MMLYPAQHGAIRVVRKKGSCELSTDFPSPLYPVEVHQIMALHDEGILQLNADLGLIPGRRWKEVE